MSAILRECLLNLSMRTTRTMRTMRRPLNECRCSFDTHRTRKYGTTERMSIQVILLDMNFLRLGVEMQLRMSSHRKKRFRMSSKMVQGSSLKFVPCVSKSGRLCRHDATTDTVTITNDVEEYTLATIEVFGSVRMAHSLFCHVPCEAFASSTLRLHLKSLGFALTMTASGSWKKRHSSANKSYGIPCVCE